MIPLLFATLYAVYTIAIDLVDFMMRNLVIIPSLFHECSDAVEVNL